MAELVEIEPFYQLSFVCRHFQQRCFELFLQFAIRFFFMY